MSRKAPAKPPAWRRPRGAVRQARSEPFTVTMAYGTGVFSASTSVPSSVAEGRTRTESRLVSPLRIVSSC